MMIIFFLLVLESTWCMSAAQPPPPGNGGSVGGSATAHTNISQSASIVLIVILAAFVFTGFVSVSFRRHLGACLFGVDVDDVGGAGGRGRRVPQGLSQEVIEGFPTYFYEDVKVHRLVDTELECAICLNQFQDHEVLRQLPECNHVFHPQCIDPWLHSQATCPVCRKILEPSSTTLTPNTDAIITDPFPPARQDSDDSGPSEPESTTAEQIEEPANQADPFTLKLPEEMRRKLESTGWRFGVASSGTKQYRSRTPESGRIELNRPGCEPGQARKPASFVSQPASPLSEIVVFRDADTFR